MIKAGLDGLRDLKDLIEGEVKTKSEREEVKHWLARQESLLRDDPLGIFTKVEIPPTLVREREKQKTVTKCRIDLEDEGNVFNESLNRN